MSVAATHASKFYEQVVTDQKVFGVEEEGEFLVFRIGDSDVVPFWSSASRLAAVQERSPKYRKYRASEESLSHFLEHTLPLLQREGIKVGLNWSGERLVGYDVSVPDLREALAFQMKKKEEANQSSQTTPASRRV